MIDVAAVGGLLAPALPFLLGSGEQIASRTSDAVADKVWEYAQRLWQLVRSRVNERPAAQKAAEDVLPHRKTRTPGGRSSIRLRKLLERDTVLAGKVEQLMAEAAQHIEITVSGDRNVTIAAPVERSTIISGDSNTIGGS